MLCKPGMLAVALGIALCAASPAYADPDNQNAVEFTRYCIDSDTSIGPFVFAGNPWAVHYTETNAIAVITYWQVDFLVGPRAGQTVVFRDIPAQSESLASCTFINRNRITVRYFTTPAR